MAHEGEAWKSLQFYVPRAVRVERPPPPPSSRSSPPTTTSTTPPATHEDVSYDVALAPFIVVGCIVFSWRTFGVAYVGGLCGAVLMALVFLLCHWSITMRCALRYKRVQTFEEADCVRVLPHKFSGKEEICKLEKGKEGISFEWRKSRFLYDSSSRNFRRLEYPDSEPLGTYQRTAGLNEAAVLGATKKWGPNEFDIPLPSFWELYKEQMLAPFFVFQLFCVLLWCMDEYWYYSIFTLMMLLLFESTVSKARQKTLEELRNLRPKQESVMVHRKGRWARMSSKDLCPGDVVSVGRARKVKGEANGQIEESSSTVPADLILVSGTCIVNEAMLTGESTPQWKQPVEDRPESDILDMKEDKINILFGGTQIVQHTGSLGHRVKAPDGGCIAVVLRTGFGTSQGDLMRTILFSTERVTANTWEAGLFILFLMLWAILAAGYVLNEGLKDENRSPYKLFLSCVLIITSVIPPELPMELSIAVNTSLLSLARARIFCTEPFRIPFAGKVDVCCFDKTGTLTSDNMTLRGFAGLSRDSVDTLATSLSEVPKEALAVLAGCQSLVVLDGKPVGDPIEKAGLFASGWKVQSNELLTWTPPAKDRSPSKRLEIASRHHFSSSLKRMSVIARIETGKEPSSARFHVLTKGAPEVILPRTLNRSKSLESSYKYFASQGARVLALAHKELPSETSSASLREIPRDEVEDKLTFLGFAIFGCPIKPQSAPALAALRESSHLLVMITGDAPLTACHVARDLMITTRMTLVLTEEEGKLNWTSPDDTLKVPFTASSVLEIAKEYDMCVSGQALASITDEKTIEKIVSSVQIYARVSPEQKELVIKALRNAGRTVLMCGDGTNDVGGLKAAHVGVALLNATTDTADASKLSKKGGANDDLKKRLQEIQKMRIEMERKKGKDVSKLSAEMPKLPEWLENMEEDAEPQIVRPGDASLASPFTAKTTNISPCVDIIRQGRCTMITTLQTYKILGLNCLATAYVLSVQYLDGVKLGDVQATISGMISASFFLFISRAKPLKKLSAERPHTTIFSSYAFTSLLLQFAVHITFLITSVKLAEAYAPGARKPKPDTAFEPNLVNTVSYTTNMIIQISTFAVNYIGHPFNEALQDNKPLFTALKYSAIFFAVLCFDVFRPLNSALSLVPLPEGFKYPLLLMAVCDLSAVYAIEHGLRWLFPPKPLIHLGHN